MFQTGGMNSRHLPYVTHVVNLKDVKVAKTHCMWYASVTRGLEALVLWFELEALDCDGAVVLDRICPCD